MKITVNAVWVARVGGNEHQSYQLTETVLQNRREKKNENKNMLVGKSYCVHCEMKGVVESN